MAKRFTRRIESFTCETCGYHVDGDGYTNHCPSCLWSKHVDVQPGDRLASCHGLMEPVGVEVRSGGYTIIHRCRSCGIETRNKAAIADDMDTILKIAGG